MKQSPALFQTHRSYLKDVCMYIKIVEECVKRKVQAVQGGTQ